MFLTAENSLFKDTYLRYLYFEDKIQAVLKKNSCVSCCLDSTSCSLKFWGSVLEEHRFFADYINNGLRKPQ